MYEALTRHMRDVGLLFSLMCVCEREREREIDNIYEESKATH